MISIKWCTHQAAFLEIWPIAEPDEKIQVPFHCRSWRHEGECRRWKGAQDFARMKDAMEHNDHWCHLVLTFGDQKKKSKTWLFRTGCRMWSKLRKALIRAYCDIRYIQTWEIHRSGYPHCHIALSNFGIFSQLHATPKKDKVVGQWNYDHMIRRYAVPAGFGGVGWIGPVPHGATMAGYLGKLSRELTGSKDKGYQIPTNAPPHFRRLRASQGLLPPCIKNPDFTGELFTVLDDGEIQSRKRPTGMDASRPPPVLGVSPHGDQEIIDFWSPLSILE